MTLTKKLLAGLLLMLASGMAMAQEKNVEFTLAHETYVGTTLLSPGTYRLEMLSGPSSVALITSESGQGSIMQVPISRDYTGCEKDAVTLRSNGAGWSLASVCFSGAELTLNFAVVQNAVEMKTASADHMAGSN